MYKKFLYVWDEWDLMCDIKLHLAWPFCLFIVLIYTK